jgi:hypothetical protein
LASLCPTTLKVDCSTNGNFPDIAADTVAKSHRRPPREFVSPANDGPWRSEVITTKRDLSNSWPWPSNRRADRSGTKAESVSRPRPLISPRSRRSLSARTLIKPPTPLLAVAATIRVSVWLTTVCASQQPEAACPVRLVSVQRYDFLRALDRRYCFLLCEHGLEVAVQRHTHFLDTQKVILIVLVMIIRA